MSDLVGPLTVEIDIPITRRLKLHAVVDGNGQQIFHSRRITQVFTWLLENGIPEFTMLDEDTEFQVHLKPPLPPGNSKKG